MPATAEARLEIDFDFGVHTLQRDVVADKHRFRILAKGRRWGGSEGGVVAATERLLTLGPYARALWVTPVHDQGDECIALTEEMLRPHGLILDYQISKRMFRLYGGGLLYFRSTDRHANLRSKGWNHVNVSEAGYVPDRAWYEALDPSLGDRKGTAYIEGSPNGASGFLYDLFEKGQKPDSEEPLYRSWQFPTWTAPHIAKSEIERWKASLPTRVFQQEIGAEFLTGDSVVFGVIPTEEYSLPRPPDGAVVVGCDVAKLEDYTVLVAVDASGRMVDFKRMNKLEYTQQAKIIAEFAGRWHATVYLDVTGVGQAVMDLLRAKHVPISPFTFTRDSKRQLIENLVVAFEQSRIVLPVEVPLELHRELRTFGAQWSASGVKYEASTGHHDDCVISLALAAWASSPAGKPVFGWV